jgi:hypothetical protein
VEVNVKKYYAALYYGEGVNPLIPVFHLLEEGEISRGIFKKRLKPLTDLVRKEFMFGDQSIDDSKIQEDIYFFDYDNLISVSDLRSSRMGRRS